MRSPCVERRDITSTPSAAEPAFRQAAQIGDHVGALAVLLDAGKSHRGAGNKALGTGDELAEVVIGPGAALGLHGGREIEPACRAFRLVEDAVEIRADAVGATLFEGVAGGAFLGRAGTLLDRSGLQQLLDRLGRGAAASLAPPAPRLPSRRSRNPAFPAWRRENRVGGKIRHQQHKAGGENGAHNFIEFEGVHFRSGSRPEGRRKAGRTARMSIRNQAFAPHPSDDEISVCPRSGNPYKRPNFPPIPTNS